MASWRADAEYWRWMNSIIPTSTGMRITTRYAPPVNFPTTTTTSTTPVSTAPKRVDRQPPAPARLLVPPPVEDHAALAEREAHEHADRVQRDQQRRDAAERDEQRDRDADRRMIPHVNASRSPRNENWRGMKPSSASIAASRGNAL